MGKGTNASAYRDMDEEFFTSLEDANYECHQSPTKGTPCTLSESTILQRHWSQRRALRTKLIVGVSCLLLAGVGATALYTTIDATAWSLTMRGPSAMLRGSSHTAFRTQVEPSAVFGGDAFPDFDAVIGGGNVQAKEAGRLEPAEDDLLLNEYEAYDYKRVEEKEDDD